MKDLTINVPPFPPLHWDQYVWSGDVVLPSWAGFQSRRGSYASVSSRAASDGSAGLMVEPPNGEAKAPPGCEQVQAFSFLRNNERTIAAAVLRAVFAEYPNLRDSYCYDDEEAAELMPELVRPSQLRSLIGLANVHVLDVGKGGVAYVGFEFGCTWDTEHGLGVMTHQHRVVRVGGADTSFLAWIAEEDAESNG